jgi:MFS transporter, Spinster family, sphingosine-1-phosphate transporter
MGNRRPDCGSFRSSRTLQLNSYVDEVAADFSRALRDYFLALLCLTALLNMLDRQIFAILLEPIKRDLHLSDTQMGFVTGAAFAIVYTIAGIPLGRLIDKGNRRTILAATLLVWSGMTMCCGFARNYILLLAARMGVGIGEAGSIPATMSVVGDLYPPEKRSGAIGLIYACGTLGVAFSLVLGGYLESVIGWRDTFAVVAIPGIIVGLLFLFTTPEPRRGQSPTANRRTLIAALRDTWRVPSFRIVALMCALLTFSGTAIIGWGPTFLMRVHGMSAAEVGKTMGIAVVFGAAGSFLSGQIADRGAKRDIRWLFVITGLGPLLAVPAMLAFLYGSGGFMLIGSYTVFQLFAAMFIAPSYALAISVTPSQSRALTVAIIATFQNLGGLALGPLVVGALNDALAPRVGTLAIRYSLTVALLGLVGVAVLAFIGLRHIRADFARAQADQADGVVNDHTG